MGQNFEKFYILNIWQNFENLSQKSARHLQKKRAQQMREDTRCLPEALPSVLVDSGAGLTSDIRELLSAKRVLSSGAPVHSE